MKMPGDVYKRQRVDIDAIPEGELVFAREPMVRVMGPMLDCQLLETALLNICLLYTSGLCAGQALDQVERALVWQSGLIDVCGYDAGVETRFTHQLLSLIHI